MDKRVYKTKKGLQEALLSLLAEKPFEKINVTEICSRSSTSRVTFYTYYNDKYDLLSDVYHSLADQAQEIFIQMQKQNNPDEDFEKRLENVLDTLLSFEDNPVLSGMRMVAEQNIALMYHDFLLDCIRRFEVKYPEHLQTRYPLDSLNSFLALGFWGFLHTGKGKVTEKEKDQARELLSDIVNSSIFNGRH